MEQFSNVLENIKYDFNDWIDYTFYNKEGGCGRKGSPSKRRRCRRKKKHKKQFAQSSATCNTVYAFSSQFSDTHAHSNEP